MTTLEAKGYVATDADVQALATAVLTAAQESDSGRKSYLRTLVATTQHALGASPRVRSTKGAKLDAEATQEQLTALAAVHDRFYAIVVEVAQEAVPKGAEERGVLVNRRTNFARTALSAVRRWVRAGNDLTGVAAKSVTKASLAVSRRRVRRASTPVLTRRVTREARTLARMLRQLAGADRQAAIDALTSTVDRLSKQLTLLEPRTKPARGTGKEVRMTMQ